MKVIVKEYEVEAFWYNGDNVLEVIKWLKERGDYPCHLAPDGKTIVFTRFRERVPARSYHWITIQPGGEVRVYDPGSFWHVHRETEPEVEGSEAP